MQTTGGLHHHSILHIQMGERNELSANLSMLPRRLCRKACTTARNSAVFT